MRRSTTGLCIVLVGLLAWLVATWADTLTVTVSRANVRQGPGLTHGVIATLPRGATFWTPAATIPTAAAFAAGLR